MPVVVTEEPGEHKHVYDEIELIRIIRIDNDKYKGAAGDKAFLEKKCACGHHFAFEYGTWKAMKEMYKDLKERLNGHE